MWKRYNKIRYAAGGISWRQIGYVLGKNLAQHDYDLDILATGMDMSMLNPVMVSKGEAEIGINRNTVINWAIKGILSRSRRRWTT